MKKLVLCAVVAVLQIIGFAGGLSEGFESYAVGDSVTNITGFVSMDGEAAWVAAYGGRYSAYSGDRAEPFAEQANTRYLELDSDIKDPVIWDVSAFGESNVSQTIDMMTRFETLDKPDGVEGSKIALWVDEAGRICAMAASPLSETAVSNAAYVSSFLTTDFVGMHRIVMNFHPSANGRMSVMQVSVDGWVLTFDGVASAMQGLKSTGWWNDASYPSNVVAAIASGRVLPCLDAGSVGCNTLLGIGGAGCGAVDDLYVVCPRAGLEGSGVPANPYKVGTPAELKLMRDLLNAGKLSRSAYFALTSDIDLSGEDAWEGIGCSTNMFSGHFDGRNCTISGLKLYASRTNGSEFGGLFSAVSNAVIENVRLENVSTDCTDYFGAAVAGMVYGGTFRNVMASGALSGTYNLGGIACWATAGGNVLFENCTNCVAVVTSYTKVGGFLAYADSECGNIQFAGCCNAAAIRVETDVDRSLGSAGGFIGRSDGFGSFIEACDSHNVGEVSAVINGTSKYAMSVYAGGFIGQANHCSGVLVSGFFGGNSVSSRCLTDRATVCAGGIVGQMGDLQVVIMESLVHATVIANAGGQSQAYCGSFVGYNTEYIAESGLGLQLVESRCLKDAVPFGRDVAVGGYNAVEIEDDTFARYFYQTEFDVEDNGVVMHFSVTNGMARLTGTEWMSDPVEQVTIPSVVGGEPVVEICDWALCGSTIANIVVPASVRSIGTMAFGFNWELESIRFLGAEPLAGDAIFSNTPPTVVSYFIPTNDGWRVSATNEAFISEWPRVGECRPLLQWDGVTPGEYIRVTFDPGEHGYLQGYGIKYAVEGGSVVPPSVRPKAGWVFTGWSEDLSCVTQDMSVVATYRTLKADLHVDSVTVADAAASGESVTIRWTVGNTGNPDWSGRMMQRIWLEDAESPENKVLVREAYDTATILRDGSEAFECTWCIPKKHVEGTWFVRVETALGINTEFGGNNSGTSDEPIVIKQCPLPNLSVTAVEIENPALTPGEKATVRYTVRNNGLAVAKASWNDVVYLVKGARRIVLGSYAQLEDLVADGERSCSLAVAIPELVEVSGEVSVYVKADAGDAIVEMDDDESAEDARWLEKSNCQLSRRLYLSGSTDSVRENYSGYIYYTLSRSGEVDQPLAVDIAVSGSVASVVVPKTVAFASGVRTLSFRVQTVNNSVVDGQRTVMLTAKPEAASGIGDVSRILTVVDDEVPRLTLTLDRVSVREGGSSIKVTLTRELVTGEPLVVNLSGVTSSQCSYPSTVTIAAGEASATFEITAADNKTAEIDAAVVLRASASGYQDSRAEFTVEDDDVPGVTLVLTPEEVSEGAGVKAVRALLTRADPTKLADPIRVKLTPSLPGQLIMASEITIPAYSVGTEFFIGIVDNKVNEADAFRDVMITGAIVIESCGCSGQPSSGDVIQAVLRINDDDVPSLSLKVDPTTVREGLEKAGTLTVSHNSCLDEDLVVALSCDREGEIELPEIVTIPAGETSVLVPIRTLDDGLTDGGQLVSIYADDGAGVFASASAWIQVTDMNLPDLGVSAVGVPETLVAGAMGRATVRFVNTGFKVVDSAADYKIYLVRGATANDLSKATLIGFGALVNTLPPSGTEDLEIVFAAPSAIGDYRIAAVVDSGEKVRELDELNNTGWSEPFSIGASYVATAAVDGDAFLPTDAIRVSGQAQMWDGGAAANVPLDVYFIVDGYRRVVKVTTDAQGRFSAEVESAYKAPGRYFVGACYPGAGSDVRQDSFDILGMRRNNSSSSVYWDISLGDAERRVVTIRNQSGSPLTGLSLSVNGKPESCELDVAVSPTLPAFGVVDIILDATAVGLSPGNGYEEFSVTLFSREGPSVSVPLYFHAQSQKALLRTSVSKFDVTMAVGGVRYLEFNVWNDGKAGTGKISVNLPDVPWMKVVAGGEIEDLASGETATVTVALTPTLSDGLAFNNPLRGSQIVVSCENGKSCTIPLTMTPVSTAKGSVTVDAVDNTTYTLDGSPHLAGATVTLKNPYTGASVAKGTTGADGKCTFDQVAQGDYVVTVTADKHESVQKDLTVNPGVETMSSAFLKCDLVSVSWEVVPTEIEDKYEVKLVTSFETYVPAPYVRTTIPSYLPILSSGESHTFIATFENEGLVTAEDVRLEMPAIPDCGFKYGDSNFSLAPGEVKQVPITFYRKRDAYESEPVQKKASLLAAPPVLKAGSQTVVVPCTRYTADTRWVFPCGEHHPEYAYQTIVWLGEEGFCTMTVTWDDVRDDDPHYVPPTDPDEPKPPRRPGDDPEPGTGDPRPGDPPTFVRRGCNVDLDILDCLEYVSDDILEILPTIGKYVKAAGDIQDAYEFGEYFQNDCTSRVTSDNQIGTLPDSDRNYGELAYDSYNNPKEVTDVGAAGYRRLTKNEVQRIIGGNNRFEVGEDGCVETRSGMKAVFYAPKGVNDFTSGDEIVLSFAGTEDLKDAVVDAGGGLCHDTQQYRDARDLGVKAAEATGPNQQLTVLGHSLGGGEATYASMEIARSGKKVKTRTYNAMGLCSDQMPSIESCEEAAANTINYRTPDDPVSDIGFHVGPIVSVYGHPNGYSGHTIKNFGLAGPDKKTESAKFWNTVLDMIARQVDSLHQINDLHKLGGIFGALGLASDIQSLVDCLVEHGMERGAAVRMLAEMEAPVNGAAPKAAFKAKSAPKATCRLEEICDQLAAGVDPGTLVSTGDAAVDEALTTVVLADILRTAELCLRARTLGGYEVGSVCAESALFRKVNGGDALNERLVSQTGLGELAGWDVEEWASAFLSLSDHEDEISGATDPRTAFVALRPDSVGEETFGALYDRCAAQAGLLESDVDAYAADIEERAYCSRIIRTIWKRMIRRGELSSTDSLVGAINALAYSFESDAQSVCASVTLSLSQTFTMTREAFNGTLTMYNANASVPITDLKMELSILDENGVECRDEFLSNSLGLSGGMSGGWILDGGTRLGARETGSAVIQFIPKNTVAKDGPKVYSFGGTLTYTDPYTGNEAKVSLVPVSLTVNPSPFLHLDYFVQRDVYADDPFTKEVVEASRPAEIAVLVRNEGEGVAKNVTIATPYPKGVEVIENEKRLKVDFNMSDYACKRTALDGTDKYLGVSAVDIGTIPAGASRVAQWWLMSSLQGHFVDLDAVVTAKNSWNTLDTQLVDTQNVGVHKLVKSIDADGDALPDFLVTEGDLQGAPTAIYPAVGEKVTVERGAQVSVAKDVLDGATVVIDVTMLPTREDWNYGYAVLEGVSRYEIASVKRADGSDVPASNLWITDRTFEDGKEPIVEDRIHVVDRFDAVSTRRYVVTLKARPTDAPTVAGFGDLADDAAEYVVRDSVTVEFSKCISAASFTPDDLRLSVSGKPIQPLSKLFVSPADDSGKRFTIGGLSACCSEHGSYVLSVETEGILDLSGTGGKTASSVSWRYLEHDAPVVLSVSGVSSVMNRAADGLVVTFSEVIDSATLTSDAVLLNGKSVPGLTVTAADPSETRFLLSGLATAQTADGEYELSFLPSVKSTLGIGLGVSSPVRWILDTVAPQLVSCARDEAVGGVRFVLDFSEPIDPESAPELLVDFAYAPNASPVPGTPVRLGDVAGKGTYSYSVDAATVVLTMPLSACALDGQYKLTVNPSGVTDEAGNAASGSKSVSWSVDTTPPAKVADLAVSSPYGSVETGVYTASRALTVSGTAPEADVTVAIYAKYVGGDEILLAEPELDAQLRFSADLTLPGDGNLTVIVRLTDAEGNSSDTTFEVNVDAVAIDASFSGLPEIEETAGSVVLTFTAEPVEATVLAAPLALARDGEAVEIPGVALAKISACVYKVIGLDAFTEEYGSYVLSCDLTSVAKVLSGKTGERTVTATWDHVQVDKTAPTVTDILFDGQPASPDLVGAFSSVAVRFSEPVNVPDLAERGLIGQALFFQILDDDNAVLSYLRAADVAWDEATATASWTIDPESIPCGKARLVVESTLIRDLSGNALATTDDFDVISTAKSYTPSVFMPEAARESACPTLFDYNGDGLLDLFVGEKASDTVGKVRVYLNHGTAADPVYDSWTYLKRGADDIELEAAGCSGAQVSFGNPMGLSTRQMVLASSVGEVYVWRYNVLVGDEPAPLELWHDHSMSDEFRPIRTQTFCGGANGRKILVSGQNSRMFWLGRSAVREGRDIVGYRLNYQPLLSTTGEPLDFPEGQNHTSAVLTDVNGDAIDDLVTGDSDGNVWVYYGTSNARFAASPVRIYENTSEATRSRLAVGDIDGDGVADILVGRRDGSIIKLKGESVLAQAFNFRRYRVKDVEEALSKDLYWEDGTLRGWVSEQTRDDAQAVITRSAADAETILTSKFEGAGTLTFTWSFDGTDDSARFVCAVDGVVRFERDGSFELSAESASVVGAGTHTAVWRVSGGGKAVLRDIAFVPAEAASQFTTTSPKPIAYKDIRAFANAIWKEKGGDYETAVNATAANGKSVYENCIAGVDSSDPNAAFRTAIEVVNGVPKVSPDPDLGDERIYTFWGRESLESGDWKVITEDEVPLMRFFKVDVRMP